MAVCTPRRQTSTEIFIVRIGLGEGYRGSLSIVRMIELDIPIVDAVLHQPSKHLLILTRRYLYSWDVHAADTVPVIAYQLVDMPNPLGLDIAGSNLLLYNKLAFRLLTIDDNGVCAVASGADHQAKELARAKFSLDGSSIAFSRENGMTIDIVGIDDTMQAHSIDIQLQSDARRTTRAIMTGCILVPAWESFVICGGEYLSDGTVVELSITSRRDPVVSSLATLFDQRLRTAPAITSSCLVLAPSPMLVAGLGTILVMHAVSRSLP